jgi:hypothetical protein
MENTLMRWKETYELSFELTDIMFALLNNLIDYCKVHNIPLYQEQSVWVLVNKAQTVIKEIGIINSYPLPKFLTDEKKQPFRTDEDETEPVCALALFGY